jgi:hypothetical protein
VKRCHLKQASSANDSVDPVLLFLLAAGLIIDEGLFRFEWVYATSPSQSSTNRFVPIVYR